MAVFFFYRDIRFYRVFFANRHTKYPFFSLPDIYHAKNRDKTGETESQKKGIFLVCHWPLAYSIALLNDTVSQELCNIHYIVHIYTSSISISISYLFDFHFVFTPATCPCVFRRRVSFLQGFFSQIGIKKPVFFFTLSILPGFRKKRSRIFTMQKKKTLIRGS